MSLINEALKRARDTSHHQGQTGAFTPSAYQPAQPPYPVAPPRSIMPVVVLLVTGIALAGAVFYWMQSAKPIVAVPVPTSPPIISPAPVATVETIEPSTLVTELLPVENPALPDPVTIDEDVIIARVMEKLKETTVSTPVTPEPVVHAPEPVKPVQPPPAPPSLNLQAVMVSSRVRQAIINGRALEVGDEMEGARVTSIENRTVTLFWQEKTLILRMP